MKALNIAVMAVIGIFLVLSGTVHAYVVDEKVLTDTKHVVEIDIYKDKLVYVDVRDGKTPLLYMYDITTSQETELSKGSAMASNINIYGDYIVFTVGKNGNKCDIYAYKISTTEAKKIRSDAEYAYLVPKIYGDKAVWAELRDQNYDIYMYDLTADKETRITEDPAEQKRPAIYENFIVYEDNRSGEYDIYMYDIALGEETKLVSSDGDEITPLVNGDNMIYVLPGTNDRFQCRVLNLPTGQELIINDAGEKYRLYGNKAIFLEGRSDALSSLYNRMVLYNIDMENIKEEKIYLNQPQTGLGIACAAMYGDTAVWAEDREKQAFSNKIHIATFYFIPKIASISPVTAGAGTSITIKGNDFGSEQRDSKVVFPNNATAQVLTWSNEEIACVVPNYTQTGQVKVVNKAGESNGAQITITPSFHSPVVSVSPGSGSFTADKEMMLAVTFTDPEGESDINSVAFAVATEEEMKSKAAKSFAIWYAPGRMQRIDFRKGTKWIDGVMDMEMVLENDYSKLNCKTTKVTRSGNDLKLDLAVTFKSTFKGKQNFYYWAKDSLGSSGWVKCGEVEIR